MENVVKFEEHLRAKRASAKTQKNDAQSTGAKVLLFTGVQIEYAEKAGPLVKTTGR